MSDAVSAHHPQLVIRMAFFPLALLYYEVMLAVATGTALWSSWGYLVAFCLPIGAVCHLVVSAPAAAKWNRRIGVALLSLIAVWFLTEALIYQSFRVFMSPRFMLGNATGVIGSYAGRIGSIVLSALPLIVLSAVPIVGFILLERFTPYIRLRPKPVAAVLVAAAVAHGGALAVVKLNQRAMIPIDTYYSSGFTFDAAVPRFGLLTATRLDIEYAIFGTPAVDITSQRSQRGYMDDVFDRRPNELPFDFAALSAETGDAGIRALSDYYASRTASDRNQYTGIYEDKNLIIICAEAFSGFMVSPELTPTLYKLIHEGFYFSDYYQPAWGGSTSTGEWSELTGLFPSSSSAMTDSVRHDMGYTIANQLADQGYTTYGFHNNTYTYYDRELTHPVLGYANWIGMGNGMESLPNPVTGAVGVENTWPQSDLEMVQVTTPLYVAAEPFHVYYITVSGHANYSWGGNSMSQRHQDRVAHLPYSETVQAYIAANLELEDAMTQLLADLEAQGVLDDTVIVLTPDHYPYGLERNELNSHDYYPELIGHDPEPVFEYYKSVWVLYNSATPSEEISEPTYSLDILPTLLNLFGVEFDSRLFTGRDVFSDAAPLVIMPDYSWKTAEGTYYARSDVFEPAAGSSVGDSYARSTSDFVRVLVAMSKNFQTYDFWRVLQPYLR